MITIPQGTSTGLGMRQILPKYSFHAKQLAAEPLKPSDLALLGVSEDDLITLSAGDSHQSAKVSKIQDETA
jgi:hypothetical protein